MTEPADKFISGAVCCYRGFDSRHYLARYVRTDAVPFVEVRRVTSDGKNPVCMRPLMAEHEARSFFGNLPDVVLLP